MPTGEIIAASAALIGSFGSQILSYYFRNRKEKLDAKQDFHNNVIAHTDRILLAYETYLDEYEIGDNISFQDASHAKGRIQLQTIRKENFNKPGIVRSSLIEDLQDLQSICWQIDDLEMPAKTDMDPYAGDVAEDYLETMGRFRDKAEKINRKVVDQQEASRIQSSKSILTK